MSLQFDGLLSEVLRPSRWWGDITAWGDSAVLLPGALLIFVWLYCDRSSRSMAVRWLFLLVTVGALVLLSKLIFVVWGIGIVAVSFTGLSGHSALSAVFWPLSIALVMSRWDVGARIGGAIVGLAFAFLIAASRVILPAHSLSEVLLGSLLGTVCMLCFLYRYADTWHAEKWRLPALVSLVALLFFIHGVRFPSTLLVELIGSHLNAVQAIHQ